MSSRSGIDSERAAQLNRFAALFADGFQRDAFAGELTRALHRQDIELLSAELAQSKHVGLVWVIVVRTASSTVRVFHFADPTDAHADHEALAGFAAKKIAEQCRRR